MKICKMSDLCSVLIGYRPKSGAGDDGTDLGVAISDLDQDREHVDAFPIPALGRLWLGNLEPVEAETRKTEYFLREGDVLFLSRGQRRIAVPILEDYVQPWPPDWDRTIVLYYYFILRPQTSAIFSDFLAWLINEGPLRSSIDALAEGTLVQKVSVRDFRELSVPVPPLEVQRQVMKLYELSMQEQRLAELLASRRREYAAGLCEQILKQAINRKES